MRGIALPGAFRLAKGAARERRGARSASVTVLYAAGLFVLFSSLFFLAIGKPPRAVLLGLLEGSFGSGFALSETLVRASPILFCALATALPARLGLISVGAEGQLVAGAVTGTAFVLLFGARLGAITLPAMLLAGASGGALWGALAGALRARFRANETIVTLLLNYIAPPLVDYLVYGPWKDPDSLGWPSTVMFHDAARLVGHFGTRVHAGLLLGVGLMLACHVLFARTRFGLGWDLLRESPTLASRAGLRFAPAVVIALALGGAFAGAAGIVEASALEGRLQAGVGTGAGYAGFLVAFLARGQLLRLLPLTLIVAGLVSAGDNLQLAFDLPSSVVFVLQGCLFAAALIASGRGDGVGSARPAEVR